MLRSLFLRCQVPIDISEHSLRLVAMHRASLYEPRTYSTDNIHRAPFRPTDAENQLAQQQFLAGMWYKAVLGHFGGAKSSPEA